MLLTRSFPIFRSPIFICYSQLSRGRLFCFRWRRYFWQISLKTTHLILFCFSLSTKGLLFYKSQHTSQHLYLFFIFLAFLLAFLKLFLLFYKQYSFGSGLFKNCFVVLLKFFKSLLHMNHFLTSFFFERWGGLTSFKILYCRQWIRYELKRIYGCYFTFT